jgi:hypothetical protein
MLHWQKLDATKRYARSIVEGVSLSMLLLVPALPALMWEALETRNEVKKEIPILTPGPLEQTSGPVEFTCTRGEPCKMQRFRPTSPGGDAEVKDEY